MKNKFQIKKIVFILFAFFAFFVVKNNSLVSATCDATLGAINVNVSISDLEGGSVVVPEETCKSGRYVKEYKWGFIPIYETVTAPIEIDAILNDGYFFLGWYDANGSEITKEKKYTFTSEQNITLIGKVKKVNVLVRGESSENIFETLDEALASGVTPLYLTKNITIDKDTTIPSGITFVLPFAEGVFDETQEGTDKKHDARAPWVTPEQFLYLTMTINEGVTLTVNGTLTVAAVQYSPSHSSQARTSGAYSQIINNGNIIVNGSLRVRGLIKSTIYDSNNITVGSIKVNSGAKLYQPFMINDYAGGDNTKAYYDSGISPFGQFATINIQCRRIIEYGSTIIGWSGIFTMSKIHAQEGNMIATSSTESSIIKMHEGSKIIIDYRSQSINTKVGNIHLGDSGVNTFTVYGEISGGEFKISVKQLIGNLNVSTEGKYLSIPYTYNFILEDGATINVPSGYKFKLMPGSVFEMKKGSTMNINGEFVVYDSLFQMSKSGKMYPGAEILSAYEFYKTGMFIVDGTVNVNGTFAGIIQSKENSTINVSENASLSVNMVEGSSGGDESAVNNVVNLTLTARTYGLSGFYELEKGKIYKYFSGNSFVVKDFTIAKATNFTCSNAIYVCHEDGSITVTLDQQMQGRMLEWDNTLSKYVSNVDYYIGENVSGVGITINDSNYITDNNGAFSVIHTFSKGEEMYYYTTNKEINSNTHVYVLDVYENYYLLDEVIKSVVLSSGSDYKKIEDEGTFELSILVSYYGGGSLPSMNISDPVLNGTNYVYKNQTISHDVYTIDNSVQTFTVIPRKFVTYNASVDDFVNSETLDDLVGDAKALWEVYDSYIKEVESNNDDLKFAQEYLKDDYARNIIKSIGTLGVVTYGDLTAKVFAYRIDGEEIEIEVTTNSYSFSPTLDTIFTYSDSYANKTYNHSVKPTGISQRTINITINDVYTVYGESEQSLTAEVADGYSLVNGDKIEDVIVLYREEGTTVGDYYIYQNSEYVHPGYSITITNDNSRGTYKIEKRELVLDVSNHKTLKLSEIKEDTIFDLNISGEGSLTPGIIYEIRNSSDELVARVENNEVEIVDESKYVEGTYKIVATVKDTVNYSVNAESQVGIMEVVSDEDYYDVEVGFYDGETKIDSHIYDASEIEVRVEVKTVKHAEVDEVVSVGTYKVLVNNLETYEIKNAGTYKVTVVVDKATYTDKATIVVSPKILTLEVGETSFVYNGEPQQPTFELGGVEDGDTISLNVPNNNTVNAREEAYSITVSLTNNELGNYVLPNSKTQTYTIEKRELVLDVSNHKTLKLSEIKEDTIFDLNISGEGNLTPGIIYEIRNSSDELVARVENNEVEIVDESKYIKGTYKIVATVKDAENYSVKAESQVGIMKVVSDVDYYDVEVGFYDGETKVDTHIYDASEIEVRVEVKTVKHAEVDEVVSVGVYKVKVNDSETYEIKNVGTYKVTVVVDKATYTDKATIVVSPKTLTLEVGETNFVYNGESQQPTFELGGVEDGDTISLNVPNNNTVNASEEAYSITVSLNNNELGNYVLPNSKTQVYMIEKLPIIISVNEYNDVMYDNRNNVVNFSYSVDKKDLFYSEVAYYLVKEGVHIATVRNGTLTVESNQEYGIGKYYVYADALSQNYDDSNSVPCEFNVVENNLYYRVEVAFKNRENNVYSHVYNGDVIDAFVKVYVEDTGDEVEPLKVLVNNLETYEIKNAGTYSVTVVVDDYVTYTDKATIVVSPKTLTLEVGETSFVYNGEPQQPTFELGGVEDGDTISLNVPNNNTVNAREEAYSITVSLNNNELGNYVLPSSKTQTYTIAKRELVLDVSNHKTLKLSEIKEDTIFDLNMSGEGSLAPQIVYEIRNGSDEIVAKVENNEVEIVDESKYIKGTYKIVATVKDTVNYSVKAESQVGEMVVVEDEEYYDVTVGFYDGETKIDSHIYDASEIEVKVEVKTVKHAEVDEVVSVGVYKVKVNDSETYEIKNVGTYKVTVVVDKAIYTDKVTIVVSPKTLTLEVGETNFVYNGESQQPTFELGGVEDGDTISLNVPNNNTVNAREEAYSITVSLNNNELGNYVLPSSKTQTYTIAKRELVLDVSNHKTLKLSEIKEDTIFDLNMSGEGSLTPGIIYEIRNSSDELVAKVENNEVEIVDESKYIKGTYKIVATVKDAENYSVKAESQVGEMVVVEDEEYYDVTVGFYDGETKIDSHIYDASEIEVRVEVKTVKHAEVDEVVSVGTYKVLVNNLETYEIKNAGTYKVTVVVDKATYTDKATIVVSKKTLGLSVDKTEFVYNGKVQQPVFSVVGVEDGDNVSVHTSSNNTINKGDYVVSVSSITGEDKDNYRLPSVTTREYSISAKPITVNVNKVSSIYGNNIVSLTFTCEDTIPARDNIYNFISLRKEEGLSVGLYDVIGSNSNDNYAVTFVDEDDAYEIEKRNITVSIDNIEVTYGDNESLLTSYVAVGQLAYEDVLNDVVLLNREAGNDIGSYSITGENISSNYNVVFAKGNYEIVPRKITVKVDDVKTQYGDSHKPLTLQVLSGSMAYEDDLYELVNVTSNYDDSIGVYDIYASKISNDNYDVKIIYSGISSSVYEVTKRPLTIVANSFEVDNDASWEDIEEKVKYNITSGTILPGDDLEITLSVVLQSGVTLTEENFDSNFTGGSHTVKITAKNNNYDIEMVNGILTVTKRIVNVVDVETEYVYQDGNVIEVFNWENNISNYGNSASSSSFAYGLSKKNSEGTYSYVESVVGAGEYKLVISIVHTHAFEFDKNAKTTYDIIVNKKDISNEMEVFNIPSSKIAYYSSLGFIPGVELTGDYSNVGYDEVLLYDGNNVLEAKEVGKYRYVAVISDDNYEGVVDVEFEILKRNISSSIVFDIDPNDVLILPNVNINVTIRTYVVDYDEFYYIVGDIDTLISSIDTEGDYKLKVVIDDSRYYGERSIQFKAVPSVSNKIELLQSLRQQLYSNIRAEEKKEIKEQIGSVLEGLTEHDWNQISGNNDYSEVVNLAENDYENYEIVEEKEEENKRDNSTVWILLVGIGVLVVVAIVIIILVIKKKKRDIEMIEN